MSEGLKQLNISPEFYPFLENLSENAEKEDRMPFIGREQELEAVMETLLRRLKNNLLLVGEQGVGKTALITELASRINKEKVPPRLRGRIILEFSMKMFFYSRDSVDLLVKDLEKLFYEIRKNKDKIILFLDEMYMQSVSAPESAADTKNQFDQVQNLLKSHIADRELNIIAATTPENYYKTIKSDEIFSLHFCPVLLEEPGEVEMIDILKGIKPYFEDYYSLGIPDGLFRKMLFLLARFTPHRAYPHKAVDLLDMACSRASLKQRENLGIDIIYQSISDISRLPIDIVKTDPREHRKKIREYLAANVVNQENALEEISRIIRLSGLETDIDKTRPEGIFIFLGPAGVGKSFAAEKIAEYLFGSEEKLRVIDLMDFKKPQDFQKLIGDSTSDPGLLVREVDRHPFSVILFENIGEAGAAVLNSLGKVLTNGEIIDASGKKHFTSNIIFILSLTSLGEERIGSQIGFVKGSHISREMVIQPKIMDVLDWMDEIIEFSPLSAEHLKQVARKESEAMKNEIKKKYGSKVEIGEDVFDAISRESLFEGGFAHRVLEKIDRQIRIKLLDMITGSSSSAEFAVAVKDGAIEIKAK